MHSDIEHRVNWRVACERARQRIGTNAAHNWSLEADDGGAKHIERLLPHADAETLVEILRSPAVQDVFRRYEQRNGNASRAQRRYKVMRHLILWPIAVAIAAALAVSR